MQKNPSCVISFRPMQSYPHSSWSLFSYGIKSFKLVETMVIRMFKSFHFRLITS